jgi:hypothetical protein
MIDVVRILMVVSFVLGGVAGWILHSVKTCKERKNGG